MECEVSSSDMRLVLCVVRLFGGSLILSRLMIWLRILLGRFLSLVWFGVGVDVVLGSFLFFLLVVFGGGFYVMCSL